MRLKDKTAIVTGAGSGFGKGIAMRFAKEGARVGVVDINAEAAREVASQIGNSAFAMEADVSIDGDVSKMVQEALDLWGQLDILVNNAGTTHRNQPMTEVTEEEYERIFAVNVKSVYLSAKHIVPVMKKQGFGVILNVASTAGVRPRPGLVWYNTSKGAMMTATKAMAIELAPKIRVNAVCPVSAPTGFDMNAVGSQNLSPEAEAGVIAGIPLGRRATPEDVADSVFFLASSEAKC